MTELEDVEYRDFINWPLVLKISLVRMDSKMLVAASFEVKIPTNTLQQYRSGRRTPTQHRAWNILVGLHRGRLWKWPLLVGADNYIKPPKEFL